MAEGAEAGAELAPAAVDAGKGAASAGDAAGGFGGGGGKGDAGGASNDFFGGGSGKGDAGGALGGGSDGLNLGGPGEVGGISGLPGEGGGTNSALSFAGDAGAGSSGVGTDWLPGGGGGTGTFDNIPNLNGVDASAFTGGDPSAAPGVFGADATPVQFPNAGTFGAPTGIGSPSAANIPGGGDLTSALASGGSPATGGAADAAAGAAAAGGGSGSGGGFSDLMSTLGVKPSLGTALAAGGLAYNLLKPSGNANLDGLNATATGASSIMNSQSDAGKALQQYIGNGTLPEGYETQVQQQAASAKARIIANHASRGLPTDPTRNSALAQELNQVDQSIPALREQMAKSLADAGTNMINTGLQAAGLSSSTYLALARLGTASDTARATAIGNFGAALNGGVLGKKAA